MHGLLEAWMRLVPSRPCPAVSEGKAAMRRRATKALASHTSTVLDHLKADEDEMLRGELLDQIWPKHFWSYHFSRFCNCD